MLVLCMRGIPHHCLAGMLEVVANIRMHCISKIPLRHHATFYDGTEEWLKTHKREVECAYSF